jgi:hypothetical protein
MDCRVKPGNDVVRGRARVSQRANIVRMDDAFIQFRFNNRAVAFRNSLSRAFAKSSSDAASSISRPMAQPLDGTKKEIIMRKIFIVAAGLASLAGSVSATNLQMSASDLRAYCAKKGGHYTTWRSGAGSCEIGSGKTKVTIDCTASGNCVMSHTMVFVKPKPSTIGALGNPVSASGNAGNSGAGKPSTASGTSGTGTASVAAAMPASATANTKKAFVSGTTNVGASVSAGISAGGTMPSIGRPALRQQ